jgi:hypothetical protein
MWLKPRDPGTIWPGNPVQCCQQSPPCFRNSGHQLYIKGISTLASMYTSKCKASKFIHTTFWWLSFGEQHIGHQAQGVGWSIGGQGGCKEQWTTLRTNTLIHLKTHLQWASLSMCTTPLLSCTNEFSQNIHTCHHTLIRNMQRSTPHLGPSPTLPPGDSLYLAQDLLSFRSSYWLLVRYKMTTPFLNVSLPRYHGLLILFLTSQSPQYLLKDSLLMFLKTSPLSPPASFLHTSWTIIYSWCQNASCSPIVSDKPTH